MRDHSIAATLQWSVILGPQPPTLYSSNMSRQKFSIQISNDGQCLSLRFVHMKMERPAQWATLRHRDREALCQHLGSRGRNSGGSLARRRLLRCVDAGLVLEATWWGTIGFLPANR